MSTRSILSCSAACLFLATSTATAMILSTSPSPPPSSEVFLGFDTAADAGSYLCTHGSAPAVDLGQTFRLPVAATLDKITIKVRAVTDIRTELVTLHLGTFTDPNDETMNEIVATEIRGLPSTLTIGEILYLTLDIRDFPLEAARQYGFLLGFTGGGNVNNARMDILHLGEDAYEKGLAFDYTGTTMTAKEHDLVFFLQGTESECGEVACTPTPTATAPPTGTPTATVTPTSTAEVELVGMVGLQGRGTEPPSEQWIVPVRVTLTSPGAETPAYSCDPTTDQSGVFSCAGMDPGPYAACVKNSHTLQNCREVDLSSGTNSVDFGVLREGDADDDNCVMLVDFSMVASAYGLCVEDAGYDPGCDFNMDGCTLLLDFSLLASNFGQCGDAPPAATGISLPR